MDELETRLAGPADLGALVEIYNEAVAAEATADLEPLSVDARRAWLDEHPADRHPVVVATLDAQVVGWASFSPYRPGRGALRHTAEISYFVRASHHRRGIGSTLLRDCLARCPELGLRTLFAILLDDNRASIRLLERFGFERWGFLPRVALFGGREVGHLYYGRRVD